MHLSASFNLNTYMLIIRVTSIVEMLPIWSNIGKRGASSRSASIYKHQRQEGFNHSVVSLYGGINYVTILPPLPNSRGFVSNHLDKYSTRRNISTPSAFFIQIADTMILAPLASLNTQFILLKLYYTISYYINQLYHSLYGLDRTDVIYV